MLNIIINRFHEDKPNNTIISIVSIYDEDKLLFTSTGIENKDGYFKRGGSDQRASKSTSEVVAIPFDAAMRSQMDEMIDYSSRLLVSLGHDPLPVDKYEFYRKSDEEILEYLREKRRKAFEREREEKPNPQPAVDTRHGTKMVLKHYLNWLDNDQKGVITLQFDSLIV